MIRPAAPELLPGLVPPRPAVGPDGERRENPYGRSFWFTYVANSALMIAVSLLFRFADFVSFLGGTELVLGLIVGVGMVGSLAVRLAQGVGVDRYGARRVWLASLVLFIVAVTAHAALATAHGPAIYILQVLYRTSLAGAYGASITYVSLSVSLPRTAEAIGLIGTSGFVGMVFGPLLGDWLLGPHPDNRQALNIMFFVAAGLGAVSLIAASFATRGDQPPARSRRRPPAWAVLRRYHPGVMLLMGITTGIAIGLPNTFVRPFAAELQIERIAAFFGTYAAAAFTARIATRRLCERWGVRPTILTGMSCLIVGMLAFIGVGAAWHLVFPALLLGCSHALLFPAVVAGGSTVFPDRYRGLATALMLATLDLGLLIGAPLAGTMIALARWLGVPGYPVMFVTIAAITAAATAWYAIASKSDVPHPARTIVNSGRSYAPRNRLD